MNELIVRVMTALQARRQSGQGMVEYALILALVSVTTIIALTLIGTEINLVFAAVTDALAAAI